MPSDAQIQAYQHAIAFLERCKTALQEGQETALEALMQEYATVMAALPALLDGTDLSDLTLLTSLHHEVQSLLAAAEQQQEAVRSQFTQLGKRKQQITAYARAQRLRR